MTETLILGIETSCDETAAAVVARAGPVSGRILSSVVRSQWEEHRAFGGVVPEIAARAHVACLDEIIRDAMAEAGLGFPDLDGIAVTAGPGLIGGLIVGVTMAKAIAMAHDLPLAGVNHLEAHALTAGLTDGLAPPYLLLLVSGGHTQVLMVHDIGRYERLATTIDDALGEAFDKVAKMLGLGMPGGPSVERWAQDGDPERLPLPRPMKGRAEPHFSLAGLKTAVRQQAERLAPLSDTDIRDLTAAFQAAVCDCVEDRLMRVTELLGTSSPGHLVVAGGVAANLALRARLEKFAARSGLELHVPPVALCTDNAAMVAWAGACLFSLRPGGDKQIVARARWPLDDMAKPVLGAGRLGAKA
ncbi:MAG: hypothetical protein RLZ98_3381 [Pseudomonadota bacterium]|jgi:N6-L-threonylcarbamoyladenine synthase